MPRAYLGVCSSNILKKIHNDDKQLYNSISPDIYSSITISFYLDEYLKVDNPFIIPGASPGSASAAQAKNQEQDHLKRMENMYWSDMVPKINKEHCIWSNALIHSIEEYDLKIEDYSGLYSRLILSYPRYYRKINPSLLKQSNLFLLIIKSIFRYTINIVQKLYLR